MESGAGVWNAMTLSPDLSSKGAHEDLDRLGGPV